MPGSYRVTVNDVAREAGVSTATVVRALQGSSSVLSTTRERVEQAAEKLSYSPNPMARNLRRGSRTPAVGLVTSSFTNAFQAAVAAGAEPVLRGEGLELLIGSTDDDPAREPELARTMVDRRVSALMMMPDGDDREYLRSESMYDTPVIMVGRPGGGINVDVVMTDDDRAVDEATSQLLSLGHHRIAALAGQPDFFRTAQRLKGFRRALDRRGLPSGQRTIVTGLSTASEARIAACRLLDGDHPPTALLALNLGIGTGVLLDRIAHRRSTALITIDETDISAGLGISAITRDPRELGRRAAQLAVERIKRPKAEPQLVTLPCRLARRGSGESPPAPEA